MTTRAHLETGLPSSLRRLPHDFRALFAELCALRAGGHDVDRVPLPLRDALHVIARTLTTLARVPTDASELAALERRLESIAPTCSDPTRVLDPWSDLRLCGLLAALSALRARRDAPPAHAVHSATAEIGAEAAAMSLRGSEAGGPPSGPRDAASTPEFGRDRPPSAVDAQRQDLADLLTLAGLPPPIAAPRIEFLRARARTSTVRLPSN